MKSHLAAILSSAAGLALALQAVPAVAGDMSKPGHADMAKMEKCYGINAVGKNDCAAGAHSCAGTATKARDPNSYVLVPAGVCSKIEGGKTSPAQ